MIFFLIIFQSFLFPASKNEIQKIKTINQVNYFTFSNSNLYVIYDEFYANKIYINELINEKKIVKTLDNFNIQYFKNLDSILYLKNQDSLFIYNINSNQLKPLSIYQPTSQQIVNQRFKYYKHENQEYFLLVNVLYNNSTKIDENVEDIIIYNNKLYYITNFQGNLILKDKSANSLLRLESGESNILIELSGKLAIVNDFGDRFLINLLSESFDKEKFFWVNSKLDLKQVGDKIYFYDFVESSFKQIDKEIKTLFEYKSDFEDFKIEDGKFYIKGNSNLKVVDDEGELLGNFEFNIRILDFVVNKELLYVLSKNELELYEINENKLWFVDEFYHNYLPYLVYLILVFYIFKLWFKYRDKQIIFHTIFDLTSTGIIIHINEKGELANLNLNARRLLMLPDSVVLGEFYKKYIKQNSLLELNEVIAKALQTKVSFKQKINIIENNNIIDLMCNIHTIQNFAGKFKGVLISAIDISEELESKRMSNWAQLAHDMQTNLSIIKLNSEQLELTDNGNISRRGKIINQSNLLIKRVRDIVTVGRSNNLNKSVFSSDEIYNSLLNEFDLDSHPRVKVIPKIEKFSFVCDKDKIIRALRNAFENALKIFEDEEGSIEVIIKKDSKNVSMIIKDSGQGMNDETIQKMKSPYFTTKGEKGGSGIGTIIMQKVMEQHGGEFIISSKVGEGTEVIFKIPYIKS